MTDEWNTPGAQAVSAGPQAEGTLADNIMHFARALRAAGMPVGPGSIIDAVRAVEVGGVTRREDFRAALESVFVSKYEHRGVFDQAFSIFWKRRDSA